MYYNKYKTSKKSKVGNQLLIENKILIKLIQ